MMKLFSLVIWFHWLVLSEAFAPTLVRRSAMIAPSHRSYTSNRHVMSAMHLERPMISSIELRQKKQSQKMLLPMPLMYVLGGSGLLSILSKWTNVVSSWQERSQWLSFVAVLGSLATVPLGAVLQTYSLWLTTQPLITKSVTSAVMGCVGDAVAQRWEHHPVYSKRRGVAAIVEGLFWSGPLMHLAYSYFEHILPIGNNMGFALIHVLLDSVLLDSVFVTSAFWITGLLEGFSFSQLRQQYRRDIGGTLKASWLTSVFLLPVEVVCFRYLPVTYRVLAVNVLDIIWDTVISFMSHKTRGKDTSTSSSETTQSPLSSLSPVATTAMVM